MPESKNRKSRSKPSRTSASNLPVLPVPAEMSENDRKIKISALAFRQQAVLPIVALSPSVAQAARDSGVAESTLRRWLQDSRFRQELTQLRQETASPRPAGISGPPAPQRHRHRPVYGRPRPRHTAPCRPLRRVFRCPHRLRPETPRRNYGNCGKPLPPSPPEFLNLTAEV